MASQNPSQASKQRPWWDSLKSGALQVALAVIASGFLNTYLTVYQPFMPRDSLSPAEVELAVAELDRIVHNLRQQTGASRVVLLRASESELNRNLVSVILESSDEDITQVSSNWIERPVDIYYDELIEELKRQSRLIVISDDLDDQALLRTVYIRDGIVMSIIQVVEAREKRLYYISASFEAELDPAKQAEAALDIEVAALAIRRILF